MSRFFAAMLAAALATGAIAQDERVKRVIETAPGQPPGGPPGGGRGFGRGMGMMGGFSAPYIQMLEMKEVQEDLKLSADEKGNIPVLKDELTEGDKKFGESLQGIQPDQFREKMASRREEIEKQIKEVLGDKFTRFRQIKLQLDGVLASVTQDKEVQQALNFTDDQRTQLREAMRPPEGERRNFPRFSPDMSEQQQKEFRDQMAKMGEEMQKRQNDALEKVLTPDQKKKWEDLIGAKITYKRPQPQFGGPGGFRAFGGPGGPGGPGGEGRRGRRNRGEGDRDNPPPGDAVKTTPAEGQKPPFSF